MVKEKEWGYLWVTQDMCVWRGKLEVSSVHPTPVHGDDGHWRLRDGRDITANIILDKWTYYIYDFATYFPEPLTLQNGLFVELAETMVGLLVVWRPISEVKEIESES